MIVAQNATEELERLEHAFDSVKKQLLRRLRDVAREQLFQQAPAAAPERLLLRAGSSISDASQNGSNGAATSEREHAQSAPTT